MRGIIRIRRHGFVGNMLTTFSVNFSQFGPGAANLELEMHVQPAYFSFEKHKKHNFDGILARHRREIIVLYNNRTVTVNTEQVQSTATARWKLFSNE